jgi:O-acetyl-ADP-ribose deacetylase (regulator of RNase III)
MIRFTTGNLLDSDAEAVVNTVNTVGVMGKGIALMFKEMFPNNFRDYEVASKRNEVAIGRMFVTYTGNMYGPKWIINFPTKKHWRNPSKLDWIEQGLIDLKKVIIEKGLSSVAIPPLGAGNGGLEWTSVRPLIENALSELADVDIIVYEPTSQYQNVQKRSGVEKLTVARAIVAEVVRRYLVLGVQCTILEVQKLAWFVENAAKDLEIKIPLDLHFQAGRYGPYADDLRHLLNSLDGSYLHCEKRINDASPRDVIWFDDAKREVVQLYLSSEAKKYTAVLDSVSATIEGFESPLGMELLATVDWALRSGVSPALDDVENAIRNWPGGEGAAERKVAIFDPRLLSLALKRLAI